MGRLRLLHIMVGYAVGYAPPIGGVHTVGVSLTGAAAGGGAVIGGRGLGVFLGPTYSLPIGNISQLFNSRK